MAGKQMFVSKTTMTNNKLYIIIPRGIDDKYVGGDKGLVINYGEGGLQNGKILGPKLFVSPLKTG